jgi:hypothetical protein
LTKRGKSQTPEKKEAVERVKVLERMLDRISEFTSSQDRRFGQRRDVRSGVILDGDIILVRERTVRQETNIP